jgi:hypothetical protein
VEEAGREADVDSTFFKDLNSTPLPTVEELLLAFDRHCGEVLAAVKDAVRRTGDEPVLFPI